MTTPQATPTKKDKMDGRLDAAGWTTGTVPDFLKMSPEESLFLEMRLGLKRALRVYRHRSQLTQAEVPERAGSAQSRIAKLETGDPKATIDLLIRAVIAAGATPSEVAEVFTAAATRASDGRNEGRN